jgi:hypothetical protein
MRCNERLLTSHPHLTDNFKAPVQELVRDLARQPQLILGTPEHVHEFFAVPGLVSLVQAKYDVCVGHDQALAPQSLEVVLSRPVATRESVLQSTSTPFEKPR